LEAVGFVGVRSNILNIETYGRKRMFEACRKSIPNLSIEETESEYDT
jgi:hypothetical protein